MGDNINLKLGGDTEDFKRSAEQALKAMNAMEKGAKELRAALQGTAKATDEASGKTSKQTDENKKIRKETDMLGTSMGRMIPMVKGFVLSWVGLSGVQRVMAMIRRDAEATIDAQRMLGRETMRFDIAAVRMAEQTGETHAQGAERLKRIMKAGRFAEPGAAYGMGTAGNIMWAALGRELEMQLTELVSQFMARKQVDVGLRSQMINVLGEFGVKDTEEAKRLMEVTWKGYRQARSEDFGVFAQGLMRMAPLMTQAGVTPEQQTAMFVRGRQVTVSEQLGAQMNVEIFQAVQRADVQKALAKKEGMTQKQWLGRFPGYTQQFEQFAAWVDEMLKTPEGQMQIQDILPATAGVRARQYFGAAGILQLRGYRKGYGAVTADTYTQAQKKFEDTEFSRRLDERTKEL